MEQIRRGRDLIQGAASLVVLTGAGISADSGVPTFRGPEGLWRRHRPEELATPEAFRRDPRLVWEWYAWRRERVAACRPNPGHHALAERALRRPSLTLVTQNVDGLHGVAANEAAARLGVNPGPALPLELHGSLFRNRCSRCGSPQSQPHPVATGPEAAPPRCPECGGIVRPDVVWFGEPVDPAVLERALDAATAADVCLVVGTSAVVHPAAGVALTAVRSGAELVEVNPAETPLSSVARVTVRGRAADVLPPLLAPDPRGPGGRDTA